MGPKKYEFSRVRFNQITKTSILESFADPKEIDQDLVDAQQARRFLDRVVGFELSPLLWEKIARNLSAGRVQSVALRLLVEREHLIQAFVPEEFWEVSMLATNSTDQSIKFSLNRKKSDPLLKHDEAKRIEDIVRSADLLINDVSKKPVKVKPKAPFITSTLQQACCNVEVIKGALGLTFTGFFDTSLIRRSADLTISSIRLASSCFKSGSDFFLFKENLIL